MIFQGPHIALVIISRLRFFFSKFRWDPEDSPILKSWGTLV